MANLWLPETKEMKAAAKKRRLSSDHERRLEEAYTYYASTDVPLDRICSHLGVDANSVMRGLARHGRQA